MENITINDILYALITILLPLVFRYVYQLVSIKVSGTQYASAVNAVFAAVEYVNQTYVDALKKEGSFDAESQMFAFEMAKDAALNIMEESTYKWLSKSFDNIDDWLDVQIESAVKASKIPQ